MFFKQTDKYHVNRQSVSSTELSSFLEDAMDSAVEGRERVPEGWSVEPANMSVPWPPQTPRQT